MKKITLERACNVIEGICLINEGNKDLDKIYRIVHLVSNCKNKHPEWRKDFLKMEKFLIKEKIVGEIK